jgi:VWFA-related protein
MPAARLLSLVLVAVLTAGVATGPDGRLLAQAGARERTIFVSALDARGEPVEGLTADDFVVTEDGRRREVLRVSRAVEPMDIAVLVDNSAAADRAISSLRDGLRGFVSALAPDHQIAIVTLADRPTIVVDYTSNRAPLNAAAGRLFSMSSSGMTLLDAIVEVSAGLRRREATRAVIVPVITTGVEFTNRHGRDVISNVRQAGASLHAIVVGVLDFASIEERERALVLDEGTRSTGGQHVTLLTESALVQGLQKLARQLSSQYKVVYGRPDSLVPPDKFEVTSARAGVTMRGTPARGQTGSAK